MSTGVRNLVSVQEVGVTYAGRAVLDGVSLGVAAGDRIGVVGRNGDGKSTLLRLIAGTQEPDTGAVTHTGGLHAALLGQGDDLDPTATIRRELVGGRADHEWAGNPAFRAVLDGLLGGVTLSRFPQGLDTVIGTLSGGERRRVALAKLLIDGPELLLLDEPTNHLDIEGVAWLAAHMAARRGTLVVVTHDRWFLDAVCTTTWEVADGGVYRHDGGYAAFVLARAERDRVEAQRDERRRQLVRKELAWLRRGPPARTSKPRFRIEAANALIADVPEVRNTAELLRFATARLGNTVLEAEEATVRFDGGPPVLDRVTWRLGPGDRVALVGANGCGKTTLIRLLAGAVEPEAGAVTRGVTVRLAHLSQDSADAPGHLRVLEALEEVRLHTSLSDGRQVTAGELCERFGFRGARAGTLVRDLSGGERRRLQLMRLLMAEPNVLLLDEPTNDLDIDTLSALEDLLDAWPGTLVVVSHDRWFLERVCDDTFAVMPGGRLRHLPGGVEEYVRRREEAREPGPVRPARPAEAPAGAVVRQARKDMQRIERDLDRLADRDRDVHARMADNATDHELLRDLTGQLRDIAAQRDELESRWMLAAEAAGEA